MCALVFYLLFRYLLIKAKVLLGVQGIQMRELLSFRVRGILGGLRAACFRIIHFVVTSLSSFPSDLHTYSCVSSLTN